MESDAENGATRNDVLSQSYVECVERVAQQKSDGGLSFVLPKEVLEEREKVWSEFFHKYDKEVSNDVELDMNTMKPPVAEGDEETEEAEDDEEEEDEEDEDDEEDEEDKEYDSKCRAPLRKLPALIQYWIDTGNPPYRLVGDDDETETGSSLSEGEHSRSGHSAVLKENSEKQKSNTSRCSSVDTAAYILSNMNITKKAEAMAIVEGAKSSEDRFVGKVSPVKEVSAESSDKANNAITLSPHTGKRSQLNDFIATASQSPQASSPGQQSVKLSEILPELQEFDEMLKKSSAISTPRTCSSIDVIRRNLEDIRPADALAVIEPKELSGVFPVIRKKLQNRRKLYTGRDSPVDLVVERPIGQVMGTVRRSLHPALETSNASRVRTKRKRKRASHVSEINSQDENTSQQSDQPVGNENSKSDARYTDFFESLGLTPSKIIAGKPRVRRPIAKRSKIIERRILPRKAKNVGPLNDSIESSFKESGNNSQTEDSASSPVTKAQNLDGNSEKKVFCGEKTLRVKIERLSDECLARYSRKIPPQMKHKEPESNESQICSTSSGRSSGKKLRRLNQEKIEVLTTVTHDSDSSTILICACSETENVGKCDSDVPMFSKNDSQTKRTSLRPRGHKLSMKAATGAVKSVATKNINDNLPETFVQLEKLKIPDVQKTAGNLDNSTIKFKTSISPQSPDENGNKSDLFGSNVSERVAVGNRIFGAPKSYETTEKSRSQFRATRSRCTLGILMPSDDEEDSFVKLISEIGSKRSSTDVTGKQNNSNSNGDEKSQNQFAISTSSDDDDDVKTGQIKRRTRNLLSWNQKKRREKRKTDDGLAQEINNEGDAIKLDNRLDESNRRKLTSEKTAKDNETTEAEKRTTRGSKSRNKTTKDSVPAPKEEARMEIEDSETRINSNVLRRSTRHNSSMTELPKNQLPAKDLFRFKSTDTPTDNPFVTLDKSNVRNTSLPAWVDSDLSFNDANRAARSALKIANRSEGSESRSTFRPARDVERVAKASLSSRFQTRLNSDSDTEFEGLRFSLRGKHNKRGSEEERDDAENAKSKGSAETPQNKPEIGETEILRTSPRRSSKDLMTRMRKMSERKLKKRGRNLFDDGSKSAEKGDNCFQNEAMDVETFNNGILSLNELPTNGMKNSPVKERKTRERKGQSLERRTRKNSRKSEPLKNQSPIAKRQNRASRGSPPAKRNNLRRTRILGKPTEWASDDDTDSNDNKISSPRMKQGRSIQPLTNGNRTKQLNDGRQSTKNLFSTSTNIVEDVDLLFDVGAKSRGNKNAVVIPKLNFASTKNHESLDSRGSSTISFRTRLRSDTEDDGES